MGKRIQKNRGTGDANPLAGAVLGTAYLQVLGMGTDVGDTSPSLLLFTNKKRYVFNVGEGFQRFCMEYGISVRKLSRIFFTRVSGETSGGLTGLLLTVADGATEHHADEPELHIHGPPRVERLMGAVNTLVGGRGVRTITHPFALAPPRDNPAGARPPVFQDDVITVTPIVVNPNRRGPLGPLGALRHPPASCTKVESSGDGAATDLSPDEPARKRVKLGPASSASAMSLTADVAESVCYHVQLCGMLGKFDGDAAMRLGVPNGPLRGALKRGEDVTLEDGRVVKSSECVAAATAGVRFIVIDCPTSAHFAELARADSPTGVALAALANGSKGASGGGAAQAGAPAGAGSTTDASPNAGAGAALESEPTMKGDEVDGEVGALVVVMHLTLAEIATSPEYVAWIQSCAAFRNAEATLGGGGGGAPGLAPVPVRHVMVHGAATAHGPIFRASATVNSRLHAVDARVFPEPLFSTQAWLRDKTHSGCTRAVVECRKCSQDCPVRSFYL